MTDTGKPPMEITRSYTDHGGKLRQESVGFPRLSTILTENFPGAAMQSRFEGQATIECYIAGDHMVDACVVSREYPMGYGFGQILEAMFNGHIKVGDVDAGGFPTAHRLLKLTVRWQSS